MIMITIDEQEYGILEAKPKMIGFCLPHMTSFSEICGIYFTLYDKNTMRVVYKVIDRAALTYKVIYNGVAYDPAVDNFNKMEILYKKIETDLALDELE